MARDKSGSANKETTFAGHNEPTGKGHKKTTEETRLKKGYDPRFNGPNKNRSCTDVIFCLVFIVFLLGLAVVAFFAFYYGDPKMLIYPSDSEGNLCGLGNKAKGYHEAKVMVLASRVFRNLTNMSDQYILSDQTLVFLSEANITIPLSRDKKYLFFFDLSVCGRMGPGVFVNGCPTPQICVEECPTENYVFVTHIATKDVTGLKCKDSVDLTKQQDVAKLVKDKDCAPYYLKSKSVLNRCLPIADILNLAGNIASVNSTQIQDSDQNPIESEFMKMGLDVYQQFLNAKEFGEKIVADVVASWWMILVGFLVAMIISLIWITLMRWLAGFMVWLTILAFVAIWLGLTAACWYLYFNTKGTNETMTVYLVWRMTFEKENLFLAGGIIFGIIFIIVFLILLFLCQRIRIAVALIKQGSKGVGAMWSTLLWPVLPFILQIAVVAIWGCIATYLASVGRNGYTGENNLTLANGSYDYQAIEEKTNNLFQGIPCDVNDSTIGSLCGFIKYGKGDYTIYLQIYNLFMLFWLVNFVAALGQLTLSGAFASWYWAFDKPKDVPSLPLLGAFWRCFRYHLGSLAFGSLLIAIVQLIRTLLDYLDHKLNGSENPVAKFFLKCLKCCFWCLEKFLRFVCKNAYIMMGVYGKNFCRSAIKAFKLIVANCVRAFVLDKVTDFLLFVCKLVVVGATGVIAYFFFDRRIEFLNEYRPQLNFYLVPIIIVILGSYVIADIFFSVYEMAVDTIFLCFLEDLERNDGSQEKPYFMGKGLMKILGKKNFKVKEEQNNK